MEQKKFRKSSKIADEIRMTFEHIKAKKISLTIWQDNEKGEKNIKGALINTINKIKKRIHLEPIENSHFDFKKEQMILFFSAYKSVFGKSQIAETNTQQLIINFPNAEGIRLSEDRSQVRIAASFKIVYIQVKNKKKRFTFKLEDISLEGIGFKISIHDRWYFDMKEEVLIEAIGDTILPNPISITIMHISGVSSLTSGQATTFLKIGAKFHVPLSQEIFINFISQLC